MRYRLRPQSVSRKTRRARLLRALLPASFLILSLLCVALLSDFSGKAAASIQLVRLSVTADSGLVRIEIIADGSLEDATVEQFSRGSQTVIRFRGARSLLKQSYEVNEATARSVRTLTGEREGEPFVDVIITLGDGATVAQKKSFNRLVIGVASDFARLRRRSADVARSRPESSPALAPAAANSFSAGGTGTVAVAAGNRGVIATEAAAVPVLPASAALNVFRGRTIWASPPSSTFRFSRSGAAGLLPMFFSQQDGSNAGAQSFSTNFVNMTLDPPGAERGVWIAGTTASDEDQVGGRGLGSGFLRPSFRLDAVYDDNFFYRSAEGRNLGIFTFAPRLEYELPGAERALRLAYEGRIHRLTNGKWANGHTVDLDSRFDLTAFLRLSLRDHFVRSALDSREFDAAGEVYIVGDTFYRNDAGLRLEYQLNSRSRLALDGGYNLVRWSEDHIEGAPLFINYDEASGAVSFERDISEETTGFATFTFTNGLTSAPLRPQFDSLNDFQRYAYEIGARTRVSESSGGAFKVGYERSIFRNAPGANDFSGLTFDLRYRRDFTASTNFELAALRKTQVSAFNLEGGNARLISTGGAARIETAQTENLKLALGLNYQQLGFPVAVVAATTASGGVPVGQFAGERRKDHLYGFSFEAGYNWSDLFKTRLVYSFARRDSTIPVFTFNRNRLSLVFEIGRRNEVKGRPF